MALPLQVNHGQDFKLLYNPYQQAFMQARRQRLADGTRAFNRLCIIAGRRGGKTLIGAVAAVDEASVPNTMGWCVAPTYMDLHDYLMPAFFKVLPQSWILPGKDGWSAEHKVLTLRNGSQIAFRSAEEPERMRGQGLHWLWLDEARKTRRVVWDTAAPSLTEHRGVAWVTTSPNGRDWVFKTFWQRANTPKYQRPGYWACKYKTVDNPIISTEEIEEARATTDPLWFKQEWEGEFITFEGAIYGDRLEGCVLHTDKDVQEKFLPEWPRIPPELPCIIGLDPGSDHPFAAVKMIATPNGLLVVDEYLKRLRAYADHADELRLWKQGHHEVSFAIDKSALQAQIELATHGIMTAAAENNQILGTQRVQSWLKTLRMGIVEDRCPRLIDEMRGYRYKDPSSDPTREDEERRKEAIYKLDDDLCDALRYAVMMWPELPQPAPVIVGRDPRTLAEDARWAWEREQRCNREREEGVSDWGADLEEQFVTESPVGDMWAW